MSEPVFIRRALPLVAFVGGLALGSWGVECRAQTIGVDTVTAHATGGYRWYTPGLYIRTADGITAGILRNSEGDISAHISQSWRVQPLGIPLDLTAGAISGYRRAPLLPLATASVLLGQHHRVVWIPGKRGGALHLAVEF